MRTLYHNLAQWATLAHNSKPLAEKIQLPYRDWLAEQGAVLRLRESDNTWWIDFADEREYLLFALKWL